MEHLVRPQASDFKSPSTLNPTPQIEKCAKFQKTLHPKTVLSMYLSIYPSIYLSHPLGCLSELMLLMNQLLQDLVYLDPGDSQI